MMKQEANKSRTYTLSFPSKEELAEIKVFFSSQIGIDEKIFNNHASFYNQLREKLDNSIAIDDSTSLVELFKLLNIGETANNRTAYLLEKPPAGIFKIKIDDLIKNWAEIWSPPADDAIALYLPGVAVFMVTHYDVLYYKIL